MNSIYFDSALTDDSRRSRLYDGQLFVFSPRRSSLALCQLAEELIRTAFGNLEPKEAQRHLPVEQYAEILGKLKPTFTHHPKAKELLIEILGELGCDLSNTFFDVPKLRTSTSDGYLTSGIAYAWHPHRDTWYSGPQCQLNWWVPIYDLEDNSGVAFHPYYWNHPVKNDSANFNYYVWNKEHRGAAAKYIKQDTRPLSRPTEPVEMEPQIRPICTRGSIIVFSGAQLHSSVPNTSGTTRFSFDFRTVNLDDLKAGNAAPNIDSKCTGTALRDFLRCTDLSRIAEEVVARYDDGTSKLGDLVYQPSDPAGSNH
jgi:hypothetical protein